MDPFSITTGVVGLSQALVGLVSSAQQLRASIEKVAKARTKARCLASDVQEVVSHIDDFYSRYHGPVSLDPALLNIVLGLQRSLEAIVQRCNVIISGQNTSATFRGLSAFKSWIRRNQIEEEMQELRDQARECQLKFITLASLSLSVTAKEVMSRAAHIDTSITQMRMCQCLAIRRTSEGRPLKEPSLGYDSPAATADPRALRHAFLVSKGGYTPFTEVELQPELVTAAFLRLQVRSLSTKLSGVIQHTNWSALFAPSTLDPERELYTQVCSTSTIDYEAMQHQTILKATRLIETIHSKVPSLTISQFTSMLSDIRKGCRIFRIFEEGVELSASAVSILQMSYDCNPGGYRVGLAISLQQDAATRLSHQLRAEAAASMRMSVALYRKLVLDYPLPISKVCLAECLQLSSFVYQSNGDDGEAHRAATEALHLLPTYGVPGVLPTVTRGNPTSGERSVPPSSNLVDPSDVHIRARGAICQADVVAGLFCHHITKGHVLKAYQCATEARGLYHDIAKKYPSTDSVYDMCLLFNMALLEPWAEQYRSDEDTVALYDDAFSNLSSLPPSSFSSELRTFLLYSNKASFLFKRGDWHAATRTNLAALPHWSNISVRKSMNDGDIVEEALVDLVKAALSESKLHILDPTRFGARSSVRLHDEPHLNIPLETPSLPPLIHRPTDHDLELGSRLTVLSQWCQGLMEELDGDVYASVQGMLSKAYAHLGDFDGSYRAGQAVSEATNAEVEGRLVGLGDVVWACGRLYQDHRSVDWARNCVDHMTALFPTRLPDQQEHLALLGAAMSDYSRTLEIRGQSDQALKACERHLSWYASFASPSVKLANPLHIVLLLDVSRILHHQGKWSEALNYTTTAVQSVVDAVAPLDSWPSTIDSWWTQAILLHTSYLVEYGYSSEAIRVIGWAVDHIGYIPQPTLRDSLYQGALLCRRDLVLGMEAEGGPGVAMRSYLNPEIPPMRSFLAHDWQNPRAYWLCGFYYTQPWLETSMMLIDIGESRRAAMYAKKAIGALDSVAIHECSPLLDFSLAQLRADSGIALAMAWLCQGHLSDARSMLEEVLRDLMPLLTLQENLYPPYATALRLLGWLLYMYTEPPTQYHHHGRFKVAGGVLPDAITAYRTYGDPSNPCIVFPTCFGAKLANDSQAYMVGEGKVLDPSKYYIVTFALFSNGESSSPSNTPAPHNGPYFPAVSYEDNINAQYAVLQALRVKKVHMVIGFSMGGQQTYHWAVMYPDFVERFVCICGSARTSPHNKCFLEGPKAALMASKDFENGHYTATPQHGIRAFGRVYSAWAYGQTWFREHLYKFDGEFPDLDSFLRERWEGRFLAAWDANDLLTLLHTWQNGDVSKIRHNGDLAACLRDIKAKALIMPSKTDLYFPPEDSVNEMASLAAGNSRLVVIDTVWGHTAGGGSNVKDDQFVQNEVHKFLAE